MNRREFLKFLGGAAAVAAVAPKALAEELDRPIGIQGPCGGPGPIGVPGNFIVLEPGMSVQEAISALPQDGGTVYIREGRYIVDEAIVILKVETEGSAIPQLVYIYQWKDGKPELIWNSRTGDRADGGLKDLRFENNLFTIELYGQDRFLLGETETGKITGDEEQICCPTFFTRTAYKWNGRNFQMQGKRLSFEIANPSRPPLENYGDIVNNPKFLKKK